MCRLESGASATDHLYMTTETSSVTRKAPKVSAATIAAAAVRLAGTVVLDLADFVVGPAIYDARLQVFRTMEGEDLGEDDGTLVSLLEHGVTARDLVEEHGTPGRAATALNARLRAEFATETSSAVSA